MAIVKGAFELSGSFGNASFYTRRGSDKVIVRMKGGASKNKIKNSPKFEGFRLQQNEWKGCTSFASILRYALGGLHRLADYNLTPVLNAFAKNLQKMDTVHESGKRSICLTSMGYTFENFNLNRSYPFNSVLRVMVAATINRAEGSAEVKVPRVDGSIDVSNVQRLPYMRLIVSMGILSDMHYVEAHKCFTSINPMVHGISEVCTGQWVLSDSVLEAQTIRLQLDKSTLADLTDDCSLILSMGIEFGKVGFSGLPEAVKYAGSARVLRVE